MYFITHFRHVKGIQLEVFAESQKKKAHPRDAQMGLEVGTSLHRPAVCPAQQKVGDPNGKVAHVAIHVVIDEAVQFLDLGL